MAVQGEVVAIPDEILAALDLDAGALARLPRQGRLACLCRGDHGLRYPEADCTSWSPRTLQCPTPTPRSASRTLGLPVGDRTRWSATGVSCGVAAVPEDYGAQLLVGLGFHQNTTSHVWAAVEAAMLKV